MIRPSLLLIVPLTTGSLVSIVAMSSEVPQLTYAACSGAYCPLFLPVQWAFLISLIFLPVNPFLILMHFLPRLKGLALVSFVIAELLICFWAVFELWSGLSDPNPTGYGPLVVGAFPVWATFILGWVLVRRSHPVLAGRRT